MVRDLKTRSILGGPVTSLLILEPSDDAIE